MMEESKIFSTHKIRVEILSNYNYQAFYTQKKIYWIVHLLINNV